MAAAVSKAKGNSPEISSAPAHASLATPATDPSNSASSIAPRSTNLFAEPAFLRFALEAGLARLVEAAAAVARLRVTATTSPTIRRAAPAAGALDRTALPERSPAGFFEPPPSVDPTNAPTTTTTATPITRLRIFLSTHADEPPLQVRSHLTRRRNGNRGAHPPKTVAPPAWGVMLR